MSTPTALAKLSHANSHLESRLKKAQRIESILRLVRPDLESTDLLDIGTGSGMIASYFRPRVRSLHSVDVVDERVDSDFDFTLMASEELPVADASYDLAVSNHVIEHVDDPLEHLREIARVLRPGGVCYLATPNRLWPIEPHFNLPFLAWLPAQRLQDAYVRRSHRGARYDANLLTLSGLNRLAVQAGLEHRDVSLDLATVILQAKLRVDPTPAKPLWPLVSWAAPSLVVLLTRPHTLRTRR